MTPEQVAEQIEAAIGRPDFHARLQKLRSELSLDVIESLKQRAHNERLRNARRSLRIADATEQAAALLASPEAHAIADWAKGNALFHHSEYAAALAAYRRAEQEYQRLGRSFDVVKLQINQIAALRGTGDHRAAIALAEQARVACMNVGEPARRALAILDMNLGAIQIQVGELDTALEVLERGRVILVALGDEIETARMDINRANVLQELGRFAEADKLLSEARAILDDRGYEQEAARADYNLGTLSYRRGQYQAALRHFERARSEFAMVENEGDVAMVDLFRSLVYRDLNLLRETVTLAAAAERTMKRDAAGWLRALAQINQGVAYRRLGARPAAEQQLLRARRNLQRQGASMRVLSLDLERAHLALEAGQIPRARRIVARVARRLDRQAWPELDVEIELLMARCDLAHLPSAPVSALRRSERALQLAQSYALPSRTTALWLLGRSWAEAGNLQGAWQALSASMDSVEQARAMLPIDEFSISFMEDKLSIYTDAVRVSRRLGNSVRVLRTLDRATAAPLPRLRSASAVDGQLPIDPVDIERLRELRELWHWQQSQAETADIVQGRDSSPTGQLRSNMRLLEDEISELSRRMQVQTREAEQQLPNGGSASDETAFLASLQGHLLADETLIQYFEDDGEIGALLVTRSSLQLQPRLVSVAALHRLLGAWRLTIQTQQMAVANSSAIGNFPHLRRMYDLLVQPLAGRLSQTERLWLVLPPNFHDLPFAAFFDGNRYLVEQHIITHISAASALIGADTRLHTMLSTSASALIVGYSDGGRLPLTLAEAAAVQDALKPAVRTFCLIENAATAVRFRAAVQQHSLLHLATHAVFRADNPMFSWIRLADTRLTVADLYELTLPERPLVVLSACETGRGTPRGGGLLGMGRGFLGAGASGLVLSLWPVVDAEAATLMVDFYRDLRSGHSGFHAEALVHAQRKAIARGMKASAWAAFLFLAA